MTAKIRTALACGCLSVILSLPAFAQVDTAVGAGSTAGDSGLRSTTAGERSAVIEAGTVLPSEPAAAAEQAPGVQGYSYFWLAGCGLLGLALGAAGYRLLSRRAERSRGESTTASTESDVPEAGEQMAEDEQIRLVELSNALMLENEQLKRDKEELELLVNANHTIDAQAMDTDKEIVFYMPQPNMNGRFQEASKRADPADALYAFRLSPDDPETATFEFIAKDAYLNAAIGNEPSWISIACERTNQPTVSTSAVRTDRPGLAILINGEWEITQKARITYL